MLNLWRLPDGPCVWQKCRRTTLAGSPQGEVLILKGVHRCGPRGFVELVVADLSGNAPLQSETTPFLGLEASDLERMARMPARRKWPFSAATRTSPMSARRAWIW